MNFKKSVSLSLLLGLVALAFVASPVFATPDDYSAPEQASACGQMHGAFQFYSHGWIQTYDIPRAADGQQTGANNSAKLCQSHFVE